VTEAPAVVIQEVLNAPASTCALVTVPVTVQVIVPAAAVTVNGEASVAVPDAVPETVIDPLPRMEIVYCCAVVVTFCVTGAVELRKIFVLAGSISNPLKLAPYLAIVPLRVGMRCWGVRLSGIQIGRISLTETFPTVPEKALE
jgi:hypothetical protein